MLYRVHVQYKSAVTDTRHSNVTRCSPCCIPAKTKEHKHTQSPLNAQWLCTSMYSFFVVFIFFSHFSHIFHIYAPLAYTSHFRGAAWSTDCGRLLSCARRPHRPNTTSPYIDCRNAHTPVEVNQYSLCVSYQHEQHDNVWQKLLSWHHLRLPFASCLFSRELYRCEYGGRHFIFP